MPWQQKKAENGPGSGRTEGLPLSARESVDRKPYMLMSHGVRERLFLPPSARPSPAVLSPDFLSSSGV